MLYWQPRPNRIPRRPREYLGRPVRGTLQTGEASVIAERLGCPVVSDFRVRDMAAGGLGAPLVPYTEYLLYRDAQRTVGLQNIGGIGNITVLPKGCSLNDVFAFDTGPGNMVMDALAARLTEGKARFDDGGRLAAQGTVNAGLLAWMMQDPYLSAPPPKTTGREVYGAAYVDALCTCPDAGCFPAGHAVHRDALYSRVHPGGVWNGFAPQRPSG
ncbi:MAG: anhydro-N-acetylmuramic acid kinase [Ruthenibacterium lactatiformans]